MTSPPSAPLNAVRAVQLGPSRGYGLVAARALAAGERLLEVPLAGACWTKEAACERLGSDKRLGWQRAAGAGEKAAGEGVSSRAPPRRRGKQARLVSTPWQSLVHVSGVGLWFCLF